MKAVDASAQVLDEVPVVPAKEGLHSGFRTVLIATDRDPAVAEALRRARRRTT